MSDERDSVVEAIREGIMSAWDWAVIEASGHQTAGRAMAEAALRNLEAQGLMIVRVSNA